MKRILSLLLILCALGARAGYTPPLVITESKPTDIVEPRSTTTVTYTVSSNVHTQAVRFRISLPSSGTLLGSGFSCGSVDNPTVLTGKSCRFKVRYVAPLAPGAFKPELSLFTEGTSRGGSDGAEVKFTTKLFVDTPTPLSIFSNNGNPIDYAQGTTTTKQFTVTISNNGIAPLTNITLGEIFTNAAPNISISSPVLGGDCGGAVFNLAAGASCTITYDINGNGAGAVGTEASALLTVSATGITPAALDVIAIITTPRTNWTRLTLPQGGDQYTTGGLDAFVDPNLGDARPGNEDYFFYLLNNTIYQTTDGENFVTYFDSAPQVDFYPRFLNGYPVGNDVVLFALGVANTDYGASGTTPLLYFAGDVQLGAPDFGLFVFLPEFNALGGASVDGLALGSADGTKLAFSWVTNDEPDLLGMIYNSDADGFQENLTEQSPLTQFAVDKEVAPTPRAFAISDNTVWFNFPAGGGFGESWSYSTQPPLSAGEVIRAITVLNATTGGAGNSVVYVGTSKGVYRGAYNETYQLQGEWEQIYTSPFVNTLAVARDNVDDHHLYIGTSFHGIIRCDSAEATPVCATDNTGLLDDQPVDSFVALIRNSGDYPGNTLYTMTGSLSSNFIRIYRGTYPGP